METEELKMTTEKIATTYQGLLANLKKPLEELRDLLYNEARYSQEPEDWTDWMDDVKEAFERLSEVVSQDWAVMDPSTDYLMRITIARSALMEMRKDPRSGWRIMAEPMNLEKAVTIFSRETSLGLYPIGFGSVGLMDYLLTGNTEKIMSHEIRQAVQNAIRRVVQDMRDLAGGELIIDRRIPEGAVICPRCKGKRDVPESEFNWIRCPRCKGKGYIMEEDEEE